MIIQNNLKSVNAVNHLNVNVSGIKKSAEKLSSGYSINKAGDNAAGLAVSEKLRALSKSGFEINVDNIDKGLAMLSVADGAMEEIHAIAQRMRELAVQSANGTYLDDSDRLALDDEFQKLKSEIERITTYTEYNTIKIFTPDLPDLIKTYIDDTMMSDTRIGADGVTIIAGENDTFGFILDGVECSFVIEAGSYTAQGIVDKLNEKFALAANGGGAVSVAINNGYGNLVYSYAGHTFDGFFGNAHTINPSGTDAVSVMYDNILEGTGPGSNTQMAEIIGRRNLSAGYQILDSNKDLAFKFGDTDIKIDLKVLMGIDGLADTDANGNAINSVARTFDINDIITKLNEYFTDNGLTLQASLNSNNGLSIGATATYKKLSIVYNKTAMELFYGRSSSSSYALYNPGFGGNVTVDGDTIYTSVGKDMSVTLAGDRTNVNNSYVSGITWNDTNNKMYFTFGSTNDGDVNTIKYFHDQDNDIYTTPNISFCVELTKSHYSTVQEMMDELQTLIDTEIAKAGYNAGDLQIINNNGRIELTSSTISDAYIGRLYGGLVDRIFAVNDTAKAGVTLTSSDSLASSSLGADYVYSKYPPPYMLEYFGIRDEFEGWIAGINPTGDGNTGNDAMDYKTNKHTETHKIPGYSDYYINDEHYQLYDFVLNPAVVFNGDITSRVEIVAGFNDTMTISWSEDWADSGASTANDSESWTTVNHTPITITLDAGIYDPSDLVDEINKKLQAAGAPVAASLTDGNKGPITAGSKENPSSLANGEYSGALIIYRTDTPTQLTGTAGVYEDGLQIAGYTNVASKNHTLSVTTNSDPFANWFNTGFNKEVYPTQSFIARGAGPGSIYELNTQFVQNPYDAVETFVIDSSNNTLTITVGDPLENSPYGDPQSLSVTVNLQTGIWTIRDIEQQIRDAIQSSVLDDYIYILDGKAVFSSNVPNGSSAAESGGYVGAGERDVNYTYNNSQSSDGSSYIPSQLPSIDWASGELNDASLVIAAKYNGDAFTIKLSGSAYNFLYLREEAYSSAPQIIVPPDIPPPVATGRLDFDVYPPIEIITGVNDVFSFSVTDDFGRYDYELTLSAGVYQTGAAVVSEINRCLDEIGLTDVKARIASVNSPVDNSILETGVPAASAVDKVSDMLLSALLGGDYNPADYSDQPLRVLQLYHVNPESLVGKYIIDHVGGSASHYIFYPRPFTAELDKPNKIQLQVGPNGENDTDIHTIDVPIEISLKRLGLTNTGISSQNDANGAVTALDKAINIVSMKRAISGADYNALEATRRNVVTQNENVTAAESQIRDTDMALEMIALTKYNILQQTTQAVLAQSNADIQSVLQLLQL